ncbi:FHA domain-containing protein [bacterium]|nr:FHA domain-containing protein [bacterium]
MKAIYYLYQESNGKNIRIEEGQEVTIGRAFDNTVSVDDASVSRHHAAIRWKKGMMYLTDMNSTNGTWVNGEKLTDNYFYELNYLDEVKIGNIGFKILDEESVISKNFNAARMPGKTMVIDAEKIKRSFNKNDFEKND